MQVEVHDAAATVGSGVEPLGSGDLVKTLMKVGEGSCVPADPPRVRSEVVDHRWSVDPFHHDLGAISQNVIDDGNGEAVSLHVLHHPRLGLHGS